MDSPLAVSAPQLLGGDLLPSPGSTHSCLRLSLGVGSPSGEGVVSLRPEEVSDDYPGAEETRAEERPSPSSPSFRASLSCQLEAAAGSRVPFPARTAQFVTTHTHTNTRTRARKRLGGRRSLASLSLSAAPHRHSQERAPPPLEKLSLPMEARLCNGPPTRICLCYLGRFNS